MLSLRPLTVDDLSAARYIHTASFAAAAAEFYAPEDIEAFVAFVRSPRYADLLLGNQAVAAWIAEDMVGLGAWSPGEGISATARVLALCVRPMFTGDGIGRHILAHVEQEARAARLHAIEVAATLNSVGFFDSLGFRVVRNGDWGLPKGHEIAVAYMRKAEFTGLRLIK
jgi:GNAT superfamily N-acetyltransferase